jgi:hypothetical protein
MTESISRKLLDDLDLIGIPLIADTVENENFKRNPDDPCEHEPNWHQFGIITHTRKFAESYRTEARHYFEQWGIYTGISMHMSEQIDGKSKAELLLISIAFHDLGKFARRFKEIDGRLKPDYDGHEAKSQELILREQRIKKLLEDYALTNAQIEYIARCAGVHYELGKMRSKAKESEMGYSIAFTRSNEFLSACKEITDMFCDLRVEIGVLFLCDSLAKTDIRIAAENDADIGKQNEWIKHTMQYQNLNPALMGAIRQGPVNIAVAKRYLQNIVA